ncbi:MAG: copper transporter [Jatrophihabitans sp.]|uniref:copper transporter n=1 Tax=Jatrophihabitans sp. TaxID=1932789 RepID=UPI00390F968A
MISFRYHLVSIVAVFLALALGIVVGTTALNGPITKDLRNQVNDAKKQRDTLAAQVKIMQGQIDNAGQFAATYGTQLVADSLTNKNVLEIVLPGATNETQDGLSQQVAAAGGKISGKVTLTKAYLDPSRGAGINSLATGALHPIGLTLPETPNADELGGALLAYVLLGHGERTDLTQVISGFSELHMLTLEGQGITPSTTVVVLGHGAMSTKDYAGTAELSLVTALASAGGHVVVAGDSSSAQQGGLVALVRKSKTDHATVSTVDNANDSFGQVSAVLALAGASKGLVGHYGTEEGANALFPAPAK